MGTTALGVAKLCWFNGLWVASGGGPLLLAYALLARDSRLLLAFALYAAYRHLRPARTRRHRLRRERRKEGRGAARRAPAEARG